ncbi:MAG: hypothetical protein U0559_05205 [Anaerolineae bacterium]
MPKLHVHLIFAVHHDPAGAAELARFGAFLAEAIDRQRCLSNTRTWLPKLAGNVDAAQAVDGHVQVHRGIFLVDVRDDLIQRFRTLPFASNPIGELSLAVL